MFAGGDVWDPARAARCAQALHESHHAMTPQVARLCQTGVPAKDQIERGPRINEELRDLLSPDSLVFRMNRIVAGWAQACVKHTCAAGEDNPLVEQCIQYSGAELSSILNVEPSCVEACTDWATRVFTASR